MDSLIFKLCSVEVPMTNENEGGLVVGMQLAKALQFYKFKGHLLTVLQFLSNQCTSVLVDFIYNQTLAAIMNAMKFWLFLKADI